MRLRLLKFLLLLNLCVTPQASATETKISVRFRDYSLLSQALHKIVSQVVVELAVTLNLISIDGNHESNDFRDSFMREVTQSPRILLRQQQIEGLHSLGVRGPRRTCIMPLRSYKDFLQLASQINDENFLTRGVYILVLLNGAFAEIERMFARLWQMQIYNVNVLYEKSDGSLAVATYFPFSSSGHCSNATSVVINEFRDGRFAHDLRDFFPNKMRNLKRCEVRVATSSTSVPYIFLKKQPSGEKRLQGRDYDLITTLASVLNFRINFTYIGPEGFLFPNGTAGGSFRYLMDGNADVALADYWLKSSRTMFFDASTAYINEKVVFVIPKGSDLSSFEKLLYPLQLTTWLMLIVCFLVGFSVIFVVLRSHSKTARNFVFGTRVRYPYFNMWTALVGTLQHRVPGRNFARFILTLFVLFCMIMRTAYQGKMYQVMQSSRRHSEPQTFDEIVEREYDITVLNNYVDLVAERTGMRTVVKPLTLELSQWVNQLNSERHAILLPYTQVYYKLLGNSTLKLVICREVFLTIPTVIYTTRNFYLLDAINEQIEAFSAAGLIDYWHLMAFDKKLMESVESGQPKVLTLTHLSGIFQVWTAGCCVSFLAFLFECARARRR